MKFLRLFFYISLSLIVNNNIYSQTVIDMDYKQGVFKIPCRVNGIPMEFIFDTGATNISISIIEASFLLKQGLLKKSQIKNSVNFKIANGNIIEGTRIIISEIEIADLIINNVEATVVHEQNAPLLLGLSTISKLGTVTIKKNKLIIENGNTLSNRKKKANNFYIKGFENYQANKYLGAIEFFNKAISVAPDYAHAYYWRGLAKQKLREFDSAIEDYTKSISLYSNNSDVFFSRGLLYFDRKEYKKAIYDFTKVIEFGKDAFYFRGNTKMRLGDYESAIIDFDTAIEINDDWSKISIYRSRALAKSNIGDLIGSKNDNKKADELVNKE